MSVWYVPEICEWELTLGCNFCCPHCSAAAGTARRNELTTQEALAVSAQLCSLGCRTVTLTGGEPLLRQDWQTVAKDLVAGGIHVSICTNGWLVDGDTAHQVRDAGIGTVSVSIDGIGETHDRIRAKAGSYSRAVSALRRFRDAGVDVGISTTVFRSNMSELRAIHSLATDLGASGWQVLVGKPPALGVRNGAHYEWLRPTDLLTLVPVLRSLAEIESVCVQPGGNLGCQGGEAGWLGCQAGTKIVAIDAIGGVKGCLAMPSRAGWVEGNLRRKSLRSIWTGSGAFAYNRQFDREELGGLCARCRHATKCRGGCRWSTGFVSRSIDNPFCYERQLLDFRARSTKRLTAAVALGMGLTATACAYSTSATTSQASPNPPLGVSPFDDRNAPGSQHELDVVRSCGENLKCYESKHASELLAPGCGELKRKALYCWVLCMARTPCFFHRPPLLSWGEWKCDRAEELYHETCRQGGGGDE